jgi:hypothetical protein
MATILSCLNIISILILFAAAAVHSRPTSTTATGTAKRSTLCMGFLYFQQQQQLFYL